jgi:adenosylhomocysteinase
MKANAHIVNSLFLKRESFFQKITTLIPKFEGKFIIVTHLLNDRPEFLEAINHIGKIALVIAIPYSIHLPTLAVLQKKFLVITPSLDEMRDTNFLMNHVCKVIKNKERFIILEIGGYFASAVESLRSKFKNRFLGVVESTESGHREYEKLSSLPCKVISVCRGSLKKTEYSLVGNSCVFSAEKIIREAGLLLQGKKTLVIGFGKVGQGLARSLFRSNCYVSVYDKDPICRVLAYSEGFQIPEREEAIREAQIIFGATGNKALNKQDVSSLKNGCILISTSSKDIEFDMNFIKAHYHADKSMENITLYSNEKQIFYVFTEGLPINFLDGAVMGPVLALVQSEIIFAIKILLDLEHSKENKIFEAKESDRQLLASLWLQFFNQQQSEYLYEYC